MRKYLFFIVFISTLIYVSAAFCADLPVEASGTVDQPSISIGDKIIYTITVKAAGGIEVEFPQFPQDLSGFAVKDFGTKKSGLFGKKDFKQWYLLDTYVSGGHIIPETTIKYRKIGATDWQELKIKEVKVEVKSVLEKDPTRADICDIRGPKFFTSRVWLYVLVFAVILLVGALIFGFIFLKRKIQEYLPPPLPAHVIAYQALEALEKKDYIRLGQIKAYYIGLSDIVRRYLENRFNLRAPEMTTEEFLIKARQDSALSLEHKNLLRDFLIACDLVKFAKHQPPEAEAGLSFTSAKKLIDQTKKEEEVVLK